MYALSNFVTGGTAVIRLLVVRVCIRHCNLTSAILCHQPHKDFVADRKATVPLVDLQHSCTSHLASFTLNNQLSMYCSPDYVITKLARTCVPLIVIQCLNINSLLSTSTFHAFEFLEMMHYSIEYLLRGTWL